jgi:hypothetical protein
LSEKSHEVGSGLTLPVSEDTQLPPPIPHGHGMEWHGRGGNATVWDCQAQAGAGLLGEAFFKMQGRGLVSHFY